MKPKAPIIICGMAHTGTTALARYLGSARGWRNYVSGKEAPLLECDELLHRQARPLRELIRSQPGIRFVLKRPWLEISWQWCLEEFPDAVYLVSLRSWAATWESWNKDDSAAMRGLKRCKPEHALAVWQEHMAGAAKLVALAKRAAFVDHSAFCRCPRLVNWTLEQWNVRGKFDPSSVQMRAG